jgi:hypothetical protein
MYQRNDNRREPRRTNWTPTLVMSFRGQNGEVYFHPADEATMKAFFSSLKKLDEGSFQAVAAQAPTGEFNGGSPVAILSVNDLRSALRTGETLFTGFEPDGVQRECGVCGIGFQPVRIPFVHKDGTPGIGGNFATLKTEKLAELIGKGGDLAARVQASSDAMTAEVMGDEPVPSRAKLLAVCKDCREMLGVPTFALETAREGLLGAAKRIGVVADRFAAAEILGRSQRGGHGHAVGFGPSDSRRFDRNRGDRPEKPRTDWHGASLEEPTATAFTAAGYTSVEAVLALTEDQMIDAGLAHAGSVKAIRFALQKATEGRQVVGDARGAVSAQQAAAPGARRPKTTGGKKREFTAPAAPRGGNRGGIGLANLRD